MKSHGFAVVQDPDGWYFGTCKCGAQQGPFVDQEDAADWYGDHRASEYTCTHTSRHIDGTLK